jgi:hypothetical protein
MRLRDTLVFLGLAGLAACGGKPEAQVSFRGFTPKTALDLKKDGRAMAVACPGCGRALDATQGDRCPERKRCGTRFVWKNEYTCGFCEGAGTCAACRLMDQPDGQCYNCRGTGSLEIVAYNGTTPACPNCVDPATGTGTKKCPICKGTRECDYCAGKGKVPAGDVKQRARKPRVEGAEDEEAPPAAPEKKAEEPKPGEK